MELDSHNNDDSNSIYTEIIGDDKEISTLITTTAEEEFNVGNIMDITKYSNLITNYIE